MKKIFGWTAVGLMSLSAFAACSSDKKSPSTTKADETEQTTADTANSGDDTATTTADGGETSDAEATVDKFCADVADLVEKGPTDSGYAAGLQELISQGSSLGAAVATDPALQTKLTECVTKLTPGG